MILCICEPLLKPFSQLQAIFRSEFLAEFLSVLLGSVGERGGGRALCREEVLAAMHAMSAVDFVAFRSAFLPHFLASMQGLTRDQVQHLAQFPADTVSIATYMN